MSYTVGDFDFTYMPYPGSPVEGDYALFTGKTQAIITCGYANTGNTFIGIPTPTTSGTATAAAADFTSLSGSMARIQYVSTAATGQVTGIKTVRVVGRGAAAGCGGFFIVIRWANDALTTNQACFVGLDPSLAMIADGDPSALINIAGFGADAGDTNLQWMVNDDTGTATKVDLGANFPAKSAPALYESRIWCNPNDTVLNYSLRRLDVPQFVSGSSNSDLPVNTVPLTCGVYFLTRTVATIVRPSLALMYIRKPF